MKRIDTLNVRPDLFGAGKAGFHDNADLPGQDATYLSPDWLNAIQEELCNLLELSGIAINPESKRQLFDLLITRKNLVNNLTTGGTDVALTAEAGKLFFNMFSGGASDFKIPNPIEPNKPWIIQMGTVTVPGIASGQPVTFRIAFPNACLYSNAGDEHGATSQLDVSGTYNTTKTGTVVVLASQGLTGGAWTYPSASVKWIAIGN